MKNIIRNKAFQTGFVIGLLISIVINFISYLKNACPAAIDDCGWTFGFPVDLYAEVGFFHIKEIIWFGLFTDLLFAFTFSLLIGSTLKFLLERRIKPLR